ncbi:MAG: hypothetical protein VCB78_03555 [Myxococcota bacterium]
MIDRRPSSVQEHAEATPRGLREEFSCIFEVEGFAMNQDQDMKHT